MDNDTPEVACHCSLYAFVHVPERACYTVALSSLRSELEAVKEVNATLGTLIQVDRDLVAELSALKQQNERLREALEFYAAKESWRPGNEYMTGDVPSWSDHGDKARAALAADQQKEEGNG